jgi:hypothetical protein
MPPEAPGRDNPKALWSLLLGIVSLVLTSLCGYGLVLGVPAVYLGWQAKDQPRRGPAIIGIVTGGLAIVIGIVWFVLVGTGVVDAPSGG